MTAEEFIDNNIESNYFQGAVFGENGYLYENVREGLIEFAKFHVKKALESAVVEAEYDEFGNKLNIHKESILNSYDLNNIK